MGENRGKGHEVDEAGRGGGHIGEDIMYTAGSGRPRPCLNKPCVYHSYLHAREH